MATVLVARARTLDPSTPTAEALAFESGVITAVGDEATVRAAYPKADVHELGDVTLLPGFIDAHHHVGISALYEGTTRLAAPRVFDVASLQAALAEAARSSPADRWLIATLWDETLLRERRPPTRAELDAAVPDRPAFLLHHTCHRALANTKALELAGIGRHSPEPSGGTIERGSGGLPTGLLVERAMAPVEQLARADRLRVDAAGCLDRMAAHLRSLARAGITRVCDTAVPLDLMPLFQALAERGDLAIPTHVCPVSLRGWLPEPTDVFGGASTGEALGPGLRVGPVKLVFDGAPGCSMCLSWAQSLTSFARTLRIAAEDRSLDALRTLLSITPRYGRVVRSGLALYERADGERVVRAAVDHGFALASHAIGNAAIDVVLGSYEAARSSLDRAGTARIEHASFAEVEQARRMAELGVAAVVQPALIEMHMTATAPAIPGLPLTPLARLLRAGVRVVGSSDYPVHTFDPLAGIRGAMQRRNARGVVMDPEERVGLDDALAMYTRTAAEVLGVGRETGTLSVGKRADLVAVERLGEPDAVVRRTWVGGVEASA